MNCPKCKKVALSDGLLTENLAVKNCSECKGTWIPAHEYEAWQICQERSLNVSPESLSQFLDVDFVQSAFDAKAALCPECNRYLSRAKVMLKKAFYVERCANCGGIWCDYGEWDILSKLGLSTTIEQLFSSEWQMRSREQQHADQERLAMVEKLGLEVANRIFELADILKKHPNGDFGVAYLMRRFEK